MSDETTTDEEKGATPPEERIANELSDFESEDFVHPEKVRATAWKQTAERLAGDKPTAHSIYQKSVLHKSTRRRNLVT